MNLESSIMCKGLIFFIIASQSISFTQSASSRYTSNPDTPIVYPGPVKGLDNKYGSEDYEYQLAVPEACKGKTFCSIKPPDYPQEKFHYLFKGHKQVSPMSWVPEDTFDNRQGDPSESDGCDSTISYEPLYQVRDMVDGGWRTVIQAPEENFVQRVRLEECKNTKSPCFTVAGNLGIETHCKQKYNSWEILVAVGDNATERIKTQLPVCCSCVYRI